MSTKSTLEQNDPNADNREEYTPPPVAQPYVEGKFDANGFEVSK